MGKPVLICPSLPYYRPSLTSGKIVFGDFSRLFVRVSKLSIVRKSQAPGYVEYGKALYTGRMRADSKVMDASGGSVPPFTYITFDCITSVVTNPRRGTENERFHQSKVQQSDRHNNVDNACQAIETAMQELVANGATAAQIDAVWAAHSNDTNLKTAVKASIASGQRNP